MIELLIIICIILLALLGVAICGLIYARRKYRMIAAEYNKIGYQLSTMESDYSDKILKYIREFTAMLTMFMFNEFIDGHDVEKINKAQIQNLISEISNMAYKSINMDLIQFDRLLFTKPYLETYIINTIVNDVKNLWNKAVNNQL